MSIALELSEDLVEAIGQRVSDIVISRLESRAEAASPWHSAKSAAKYLDATEDAIRAAEKRGQLRAHRTATGRLLFHRDDLDAFARGEA